ncbi:hypothetical protein D3C71_1196420 [compost metagenome]
MLEFLPELATLDFPAGEHHRAHALLLAVPDLSVVNPGRAVVGLAAQGVSGADLTYASADVLCAALYVRPSVQCSLRGPVFAVQFRHEHRIGRDLLAIAAEESASAFADGCLEALEITLGARAGLLRVQHKAAAHVSYAEVDLGDDCFVL